jgi:hypothetical protein
MGYAGNKVCGQRALITAGIYDAIWLKTCSPYAAAARSEGCHAPRGTNRSSGCYVCRGFPVGILGSRPVILTNEMSRDLIHSFKANTGTVQNHKQLIEFISDCSLSHGDDCEDYCFIWCCSLQSGRNWPTIKRSLLSLSSGHPSTCGNIAPIKTQVRISTHMRKRKIKIKQYRPNNYWRIVLRKILSTMKWKKF